MTEQRLALSVAEAAEQLGVSRPIIYGLIKNGEFPAVVVGQKRVIIPVAALEQWLASHATREEEQNNDF